MPEMSLLFKELIDSASCMQYLLVRCTRQIGRRGRTLAENSSPVSHRGDTGTFRGAQVEIPRGETPDTVDSLGAGSPGDNRAGGGVLEIDIAL